MLKVKGDDLSQVFEDHRELQMICWGNGIRMLLIEEEINRRAELEKTNDLSFKHGEMRTKEGGNQEMMVEGHGATKGKLCWCHKASTNR